MQVAHRPDPVLSLLELSVPLGGRQRLSRLEVQVVSAEAPREAALLEGPRRKVPYPAERRAAIVHRRLAQQVMLAEFGERNGHDGDRQDRLSQTVQIAEGAPQFNPIVYIGHEHNLRVELDPALPERAKLGDNFGGVGIPQQPAAYGRVGGVHRDVQGRQPILDDALDVPRLQVREGGEIAVSERQTVVVVADVEGCPHLLGVPVHEAKVTMIGAAADARGFERNPHRHTLGALDVVLDFLPSRRLHVQHEVVIGGEELPIQEVLERAAVDRKQLRSSGQPYCGAQGVRRHRLHANHKPAA